MRTITYAGETVTTTDDVAEALVKLTAAVAKNGRAEAVRIPIITEDHDRVGTADLVIGVGNDVLSLPAKWNGEEQPDFSEQADALRTHPSYPQAITGGPLLDEDLHATGWDFELDGLDRD
ncbi:hypothetical protein [Leucobacter sp. NPDC077196]|uniref:hypothetical protein n=1 Tax=Leucobacter sp. NPDC077196 TaxID=3154959 RepID=UPI00343C37F7